MPTALQWLTVFVLLCACTAQSRNNSIRLMEDMLQDYDRRHRPVLNQSHVTIVNGSFEIIAIQDFDDVSGTLSVVVVMTIRWMDEVINWNPALYGGIKEQIYDVEEVWYPLIVQATSSEKYKDLVEDWMTLRIYYEGHAQFTLGLLVKSTCGVDVTYYPFDRQRCHIWFSQWSETHSELRFNAPVPFAGDSFYTKNGEWTLVKNATTVNSYGMLELQLELQRKPLFAVVNTILPMVLMSILNLMVFLLPPESGERVSYSITVLLAIAVFLTLVADNLPSTSEPMSLVAFFLMVSLCISASICVATILNLRVFHRQDGKPLTPWQRRFVNFMRCKCTNRPPTDGKAINDHKEDTSLDHDPDIDELEIVGINWQTYALAIDKVLFIVFGTVGLVNTMVFLLVLVIHRETSNATADT